jgi:hypothetical protein
MAKKTREQIAEIYTEVASQEGLLYHVAHARKDNTDKDYDGDRLREISQGRVKRDIVKLREASRTFRERSLPRP